MRSSDWSSDVCSSDLDVGGALHVVVAAEDVGTAARHADHAHREPENAVGPGVAAAGVVLGGAHAPADGERAVVGQRPCDALHLGTRHAGHPLGLLGVPLGDLRPDLVHTVNKLADVLLVLPAVLANVPEDATAHRHVGDRKIIA